MGGADEASLYRRRVVEIKHGRVCMIAFIGMAVGPNELITPTDQLLSPSLDLHFDDIPGGIAAVSAVPAAGWLRIIALIGIHELTVAKQDYTKVPGEIPTFLGFKPEDPVEFADKQLKERASPPAARLLTAIVTPHVVCSEERPSGDDRRAWRAHGATGEWHGYLRATRLYCKVAAPPFLNGRRASVSRSFVVSCDTCVRASR